MGVLSTGRVRGFAGLTQLLSWRCELGFVKTLDSAVTERALQGKLFGAWQHCRLAWRCWTCQHYTTTSDRHLPRILSIPSFSHRTDIGPV